MGEEHLDADKAERLRSLLELGDPNAEVAIAYRIKERLRDFYQTSDQEEARRLLEELVLLSFCVLLVPRMRDTAVTRFATEL